MPKKTREQLAQRAKWNHDWIAKHRTRYNQSKSEYRFRLKLEAIDRYTNSKRQCAKCGYGEDLVALCLDHINNNGQEHRKALQVGGMTSKGNRSGTTMYERIKALGWIAGLQILCFNCNAIKEFRRKRGRTSQEMLEAIANPKGWREKK